MTREEANMWIENTFSDFTKEEDRQESIFYLVKKIFDDKEKKEETEIKDRLAELEKVILDYYLAKGYQVGVGGWAFNVEIESDYKSKQLLVYFRESMHEHYSQVFIAEVETTKEMFDKAIEHFAIKKE